MINIVCLKFGTMYGPEYVNRLYKACKRNSTVEFEFHCFTDDITDILPEIIIHDLPHMLPGKGWWQKLYLFSSDINIEGRIFYIDLDTLITGNIDHMLRYDKGFVVLHDFYRVMQPNAKDRFGYGKEAVGSGVLSWEAGKHCHIWDTFIEDPEEAVRSLHPHGDQKWIEMHQKERQYFQDLWPQQVVSFKVHCRRGLPPKAAIVCYHGKPSIPESINQTTRVQGFVIPPTPWVKDHWRD